MVALKLLPPGYRAVIVIGAGLPVRTVEWMPAANPANFASHIRAASRADAAANDLDDRGHFARESLLMSFESRRSDLH